MTGKDTSDDAYEQDLQRLQLALVHYQQHAIAAGDKVLIIFEGRDAAGKDGSIQRITEHLSTRATRVVAPPKPSDRERTQWFFQRYVPWLPAAGETVIFNRSWYNRGGVEPVMGFCTEDEHEHFLREVPAFEGMLVDSGVRLVKLWLDVSRKEQKKRLEERRTDPLKALKTSPLDEAAQSRFDAYSDARDGMLRRTHSEKAPWTCVRSDEKKPARLAILRHLVRTLAPEEISREVEAPDPAVLFRFDLGALSDGRLAR